MMPSLHRWPAAFGWLFLVPQALGIDLIYPPSSPPGAFYVADNFYGISFELSVFNTLVGNHPNELPTPMQSYLRNIRSRMTAPLRLRIGGNSMDSSTYVPTQSNMIIRLNTTLSNKDDIRVTYGPLLLDSMVKMGDVIGGSQWLVSLSLINIQDVPSTVALARDATVKLDKRLDAFLLGNEPDLYLDHKERINIVNYTVQDYVKEFGQVVSQVYAAENGLLNNAPMAGPTICCHWDLNSVFDGGYLTSYASQLKYITLQHYPQNNCFGTHVYQLDYYLAHFNTVQLARWNEVGLKAAQAAGELVSMTEFNSASCGGVPGISDTFGAVLWTVDYVLQLASIGYVSAYIHTREAGVTYNLFDPPIPGVDRNAPGWSTGPPYHSLLFVAEALHNERAPTEAVSVVDLNIQGSVSMAGPAAGYAIFPSASSSTSSGGDTGPIRLVLFNYAVNTSQALSYTFPPTKLASSPTTSAIQVAVKYLRADNVNSKFNISWGGQIVSGAGELGGDESLAWVLCTATSCTVQVPGPGVALVFMDGAQRLGGASAQGVSPTGSGKAQTTSIPGDFWGQGQSSGSAPRRAVTGSSSFSAWFGVLSWNGLAALLWPLLVTWLVWMEH